MLVYQPFHIVGFFSTSLKTCRYSRHLRERVRGALQRADLVVDRRADARGEQQRVQGTASVSPFLVSARLEGVHRGEVSLIGSVRRSVIERVGRGCLDSRSRSASATPCSSGAPKGNSRYSVTALHTYDRGRINPDRSDDQFKRNNVIVSGRYLFFPTEVPILF